MKQGSCAYESWQVITLVFAVLMLAASRIQAQERLCDPAFEDCRVPFWALIDAENVGIDVSFWALGPSMTTFGPTHFSMPTMPTSTAH